MRTLETDEIGKGYGGRQVVRGVSIKVNQGEVVGLLVAALVLLVARTVMRPTEAVTGLLAAWPFAIVGLALACWRSMTVVERMLVAASSVFINDQDHDRRDRCDVQ
mgnify:CR=1 FL=1